jgi:hypothetical protein
MRNKGSYFTAGSDSLVVSDNLRGCKIDPVLPIGKVIIGQCQVFHVVSIPFPPVIILVGRITIEPVGCEGFPIFIGKRIGTWHNKTGNENMRK